MQRTLFTSNAIAGAGYDSETLRLDIEFRDGAAYRYNGVPSAIWAKLLQSESKGRYLNAEIRGRFECARIPRAATQFKTPLS
jgi:KTSC domain